MKDKDILKEAIKLGYINEKGTDILKCWNCKSKNLKDEVLDTIQGQASEANIICADCNIPVGFWGYGYTNIGEYLDILLQEKKVGNKNEL